MKKNLQTKLQHFEKYEYEHVVVLTSNQHSKVGSYTETKFSTKKKVTVKRPFFVIGPFCIRYSICLNICQVVFNLSTFNWETILQFFEKGFVFQIICFKVKVLKTLKIFRGCHIKTCRFIKERASLKITSSTVFRRTYALSLGSKMKYPRPNVFLS